MRYLLVVLMIALYLLNIADYTTTVYALNNIPNTLETNPLLQTPDAMFRLKVIYGTILGVTGTIAGFFFERFRQQDPSLIIDVCYFLLLLVILAVVSRFVLAIVGNISVILRF